MAVSRDGEPRAGAQRAGGRPKGVDRRKELRSFLQSRRARLRPADVGLMTFGQRRVAGLRREEIAQLAGVSFDYYVRLEQGRADRPSEEVLDAVASALRLTRSERDYLFRLARPEHRPDTPRPIVRVRPQLQHLLDSMDTLPAFVLNHRMDVLAWNRLAELLLVDLARLPAAERNVARAIFLEPAARTFYPDWELVAREVVSHLRLAVVEAPTDDLLHELVDELNGAHPDFRRYWIEHNVWEKNHGVKRVRHPVVGEVDMFYETLALPADPGLVLVTYTVEPGSRSEAALHRLLELDRGGAAGREPVEAGVSPPARPAAS